MLSVIEQKNDEKENILEEMDDKEKEMLQEIEDYKERYETMKREFNKQKELNLEQREQLEDLEREYFKKILSVQTS